MESKLEYWTAGYGSWPAFTCAGCGEGFPERRAVDEPDRLPDLEDGEDPAYRLCEECWAETGGAPESLDAIPDEMGSSLPVAVLKNMARNIQRKARP
jgi:hypothetical protein